MTPLKAFFCVFCEIVKNICFSKHLETAASRFDDFKFYLSMLSVLQKKYRQKVFKSMKNNKKYKGDDKKKMLKF